MNEDLSKDLEENSSNFTEDEQKTYWEAIQKKSVQTGINIQDLF